MFEEEYLMAKIHTHYDNLKVARDAPPEVIRAAYKTLCHKFHPDRHGGSTKATQTFQLINAAYEVLSNAESRHQHDRWITKMESASPVPEKLQRAPVSTQWNGRERRRRSVSHVVNHASSAIESAMRLKRSTAIYALWASVGVLGAMLLVLYHA